MKSVNFIKSHRSLALIAVLFGAMAIPAFGQQDVDPTWYNPWSSANTTPQSAKPKAAIRRNQSAVRTASSKQVAKLRVKKNAKRPTQS